MSGSRTTRLLRTAVLVLWLAAVAAGSAAGPAQKKARGRSGKKKQQEEYALLFGTVFDDNGRAVRGAGIRVKEKEGSKHWETVTDGRGEFAVHLPVGSHVYIVEASAPGSQADTKEVSFTADERQDVSLRISRIK